MSHSQVKAFLPLGSGGFAFPDASNWRIHHRVGGTETGPRWSPSSRVTGARNGPILRRPVGRHKKPLTSDRACQGFPTTASPNLLVAVAKVRASALSIRTSY